MVEGTSVLSIFFYRGQRVTPNLHQKVQIFWTNIASLCGFSGGQEEQCSAPRWLRDVATSSNDCAWQFVCERGVLKFRITHF